MLILIIYLIVGFLFLLWVKGYSHFPPPSRLVHVEGGGYKFKDYIPMPHWVWCIVLTVIWLPYTIYIVLEIRRGL